MEDLYEEFWFSDKDLEDHPQDLTKVTISSEEYETLRADTIWLQCLYAAGADGWEGFSDAEEAFNQYLDEFCKIH